MSSMTQEHLDNIAWLEQERRRIKNEEIEIARRSTELSIQRCQTELGITDPAITSTIASEVLRAEEAERLQVAAVRLYSREIQRLVSTGGQPLPVYDGVGHIVASGASYLRVGGADDYLTVHNPAYPRFTISRNIAPDFRNIKVKGNTIAIRALKNAHGYAYASMMGDRQEFPFSRPELGLLREDPVAKRQPVTARIRDFAVDAGHGRGYALAVQGHGDDGPFHDIMQALGLRRFHTVESASFNPALAAATWKFDLWSWKAAEEELKRQGQWFVNKDTMQEDPEAERWPIHEDPEEPLPSLAIVQAVPTVHEDPAAFEVIRLPTHSVQSHSGPVPWPQTIKLVHISVSESYRQLL
ncbi:hypothetical protein MY10362_006888 [Beauveria mimosiformis]